MHVAQISLFADPVQRAPEELLEAWPSLVDIAECAACGGARVTVIQASTHSRTLSRNGIHYTFSPFGRDASSNGFISGVRAALRDLRPDVLHVHGLGSARDVHHLAKLLPEAPILLQDHADALPRWWRWTAWRRGFGLVSGVAFCSREQARAFADAHLLQPRTPVYEIPESTSRFAPGPQDEARRASQAGGAPLILWVGHLNDNKDPLTVLDGVSLAARTLPAAQLWCCFGSAPLLRQVRQRIDGDPLLRARVRLLGRVTHDEVQVLMRAADLFILGSHREGSGYSLIEALASGLPPVVTDIPSFRALTRGGAIGALWPPGNSGALCRALLSLAGRIGPRLRAAVRGHFEAELSFDAVGRKLVAAYEDLLERKQAAAAEGASGARLAFRGQVRS